MSIADVINSIEFEAFSRCMNPPQDGWNGIADIKTFPDGIRWVICPFCKKKAIKILAETRIHNMPWKCKASDCKKEFVVNVG